MADTDDQSWHCLLELKLRKTNGNDFQSFFSSLMELIHGDDFIRTRAHGNLGDEGCDGYLTSTGEVFACYGAQNGAAGNLYNLIDKLKDDFEKARHGLSAIMKHWVMTHNMVEGMPTKALKEFKALEASHPDIAFEICGPARIRELFAKITEDQRCSFLGPQARSADFLRLQMHEIKELVDAVIQAVDGIPVAAAPITPVSPEKLAHNAIPPAWARMIQSGRFNAHHIDAYFNSHHDAVRGEQVAELFRIRYSDLKAQQLDAGAIMTELYEFVAGPEKTSVERQVAAFSLLAYLFESCDIFENAPKVMIAQ